MTPFKPAEIRIIVALAVIALLGSLVTLLQRYNGMTAFNLGSVTLKAGYNYSYKADKLFKPDSLARASQKPMTTLSDSSIIQPKVHLNQAGIFDFEALPGIGPALAARIIAYRDSVGQFQRADELLKVKGIGPAKFQAIKDRIGI